MTNSIYSAKICSKCKIEKSGNSFRKRKDSKDGLRGICKDCQKLQRVGNRENINRRKREYNKKNRENILIQKKLYRKRCKAQIHASSQIYYTNNKDKIKNYQSNNRDKINQWQNNKYRYDPEFRLHHNISSALRQSIKKEHSTSKYLKQFGYTIKELKTHLESKFVDGMTWNNYGLYGWHMDHIKPKSWYDVSQKDQLIECWSLSNLQPLWARDNLTKSNRFIG